MKWKKLSPLSFRYLHRLSLRLFGVGGKNIVRMFKLLSAARSATCSITRKINLTPSNCHSTMHGKLENILEQTDSSIPNSKMLSTKNIKENILAIEYPGIVKNVDYALNTMGGITNISRVVSLFSGHLSNSFRKFIYICCTYSAIGKQPREETFGLEFSTGKHLLQTDFRRRQTNDGTASESSTSKEKIKDGKCQRQWARSWNSRFNQNNNQIRRDLWLSIFAIGQRSSNRWNEIHLSRHCANINSHIRLVDVSNPCSDCHSQISNE